MCLVILGQDSSNASLKDEVLVIENVCKEDGVVESRAARRGNVALTASGRDEFSGKAVLSRQTRCCDDHSASELSFEALEVLDRDVVAAKPQAKKLSAGIAD